MVPAGAASAQRVMRLPASKPALPPSSTPRSAWPGSGTRSMPRSIARPGTGLSPRTRLAARTPAGGTAVPAKRTPAAWPECDATAICPVSGVRTGQTGPLSRGAASEPVTSKLGDPVETRCAAKARLPTTPIPVVVGARPPRSHTTCPGTTRARACRARTRASLAPRPDARAREAL